MSQIRFCALADRSEEHTLAGIQQSLHRVARTQLVFAGKFLQPRPFVADSSSDERAAAHSTTDPASTRLQCGCGATTRTFSRNIFSKLSTFSLSGCFLPRPLFASFGLQVLHELPLVLQKHLATSMTTFLKRV